MRLLTTLFVFMILVPIASAAQLTTDELYNPNSPVVVISFVNQNPDPVGAGDIVELKFMIENYGSRDATNLEYELLLEYPFLEVPGETYTRTINTLSSSQTADNAFIIKYRVRVDNNAVKGKNNIKLKQSDVGSNDYVTTNFDIEISGNEFAQIIYVDKAKLNPGNETELKFTITNVGNSPLSNLVFSWSEEDGTILPVYSDNTKYIRSIDVGGSIEIKYIVVADVNADAGLYQIDLSLQYESTSGLQEMNTKAGIFIGGGTDFDVTFSESSEGQTSLSVANTGNNPALSVTVRVPNQEEFIVSGSASSIIGNLDKGDYTIVSFQISQGSMSPNINRTTPGSIPTGKTNMIQNTESQNELDVIIEYTDTTGVRHSVEKSVPIQFRDITTTTQNSRFNKTGTTNTWYYVLAVVAALMILIVYKRKTIIKVLKKRR